MKLDLKRIVVFTADVPGLARFYQDVIGLAVLGREEGWVEFEAGACRLALHHGRPVVGQRPPKLVFFASDVAAAKAMLQRRGAAVLGPVKSTSAFDMCDGKDPDGNPFQISSRG